MPRYSLNAFGRKIPLADTSEPLSKQVGRRLQGQPDTKIDSGGSVNSFTFDGQEISSSELREIREIRESGGVISALMRSKALLTFGAGVSFEVEDNEATLQEVNGRELTLEEYLRDRLNDIDSLVLELGEDALYYPYSVAEPLENRRGGFGGITGVEPYTVIPETDEYGDIVRWVQTTENGEQDMFAPDELVHFPLNKSSARDKTGISSILRSREEIEQFRANQQAIKSAIELHGFPQRHVKVGREGSAPIRDNELRRVRNLFDSQTVDSDTVFVTGRDVEIDALEAENFEFERVSENDMRQLSLALGVPLELTNYGSDGLGSGKPAEFRLNLFKLQIEANQRQFSNIFVRDLLRPVLRDMTPYNHTVNINMEFGDPLQTEKDMATLLQEIGGYMTNAEISERFDLPKPEDEEIADAYRTPAEVEQQENQPDAGGAGEGLFSQLRELNTPQGVPDNAQYLPPGESPPEGATTFPSEGQGSYYVPAGEETDGDGGGTDDMTADPEEVEDFDPDTVDEGDELVIEGPDGEQHQVEVDLVAEDEIFVVDSTGTMETVDRETGEFDREDFTVEGMVDVDGIDPIETLQTNDVPTTPESAADLIIDGFGDDYTEEEKAEARDNWNEIFTEEAFEDLDPERAEAVGEAREQLDSNETFQEIVDATPGLSDGIIMVDAEELNTTGFTPSADAERKAGVSFVHNNVLGTTNTDPEPPEPGESVSSSDMASVLRHEYAHDVWDELSSDQRKQFQQDLPDADEISDGLTDYATERPEEAFTELLAITTHPEFEEDRFPEWVNNLKDEYASPDAMEFDEPAEADNPELDSLPTNDDVDDGNVTAETVDDLSNALPSDFDDSEAWQAESGGAFPDKAETVVAGGEVGVMADAEMVDGELGLVLVTPDGEKTVKQEEITHTYAGGDIELQSHTRGVMQQPTVPRELAEIPEKYTDGTGLSESDFVPNSDVADVIEPVLEFIDQHGLPNPDNQQEGAARINQLYDAYENDDPIHPDFWQEIANFHARHRAQGNHECDESDLPEKAEEINQNEFEPCLFDPGYFSDKTWGGTPGMEQAERIVDAIESTDGVELSDHTPEWDAHLLEMHNQIHDNPGRELLEFSDSQTPQFVKDRLRDAIMDGAVFNDIENIGGDDIFQLREFMTETLQSDGWTIDGLADQLQQLDGIESRDKARLIARTETASVVNSAREDGYEARGDGDAKFYWSGDTIAESDRTTEACDWLIRQTNPFEGGTPVPMDKLKELIEEAPTHDPEMQDNLARPDNFVVHPNERKTFVKAPDSMT